MPNYSYVCTECLDEVIKNLPMSTDPTETFECKTWFGDRNTGFCCMGRLERRIRTKPAGFNGLNNFLGDWFKRETGKEFMEP